MWLPRFLCHWHANLLDSNIVLHVLHNSAYYYFYLTHALLCNRGATAVQQLHTSNATAVQLLYYTSFTSWQCQVTCGKPTRVAALVPCMAACNSAETALQQPCNIAATALQQHCINTCKIKLCTKCMYIHVYACICM